MDLKAAHQEIFDAMNYPYERGPDGPKALVRSKALLAILERLAELEKSAPPSP